MKKTLIFITALLVFSACGAKDDIKNLSDDIKQSYKNISDKTTTTINDFNEKKEKVKETIEDIENAANSMKEASDAIKEILD